MVSIRNLVSDKGWDVDEAMEAVGVPDKDRLRYRELVTKAR